MKVGAREALKIMLFLAALLFFTLLTLIVIVSFILHGWVKWLRNLRRKFRKRYEG